MAITTLAGVEAGLQLPLSVYKSFSNTVGSVGTHTRLTSFYYVAGAPGASTAPAVGLGRAGAAVTFAAPSGGAFIYRTDPAGGLAAYLAAAKFGGNNLSTPICYSGLICDRLWHNAANTMNSVAAQTVNSVTLPARDLNGATLGEGVLAGIEVSTALPATASNVTISYTNSAGVAGRTAVVAQRASATTLDFDVFPLQAGDTGVRSIQTVTFGTSRASGVVHLVLFRPILLGPAVLNPDLVASDPLTGAFPRIFDGSALWPLVCSTIVGTSSFSTNYQEAHG